MRPWTQAPWALGCCDDCDRPWVIQTARGNRCATHHALDKAHARAMHPSGMSTGPFENDNLRIFEEAMRRYGLSDRPDGDESVTGWRRLFWTDRRGHISGFVYTERRRWWAWLVWDGTIFIGFLLVIFALIAAAVLGLTAKSCASTGDSMGRDTRFDVWAGCFIQADDGSYVPKDNFRINESGEQS